MNITLIKSRIIKHSEAWKKNLEERSADKKTIEIVILFPPTETTVPKHRVPSPYPDASWASSSATPGCPP